MDKLIGAGLALALLAGCASAAPLGNTACAPEGRTGTALTDWRAAGFVTDDADTAAWDLAACLASPDPGLRDGIGYEGLTALLRRGDVSDAVRLRLSARLGSQLSVADAAGVTAPFSALALSEVARTDRVDPFLTDAARADLVEAAAAYLESVSDYRGFDDSEGWRHGVAHGADLAMQLALNPAVDAAGLRRLRAAVGAQIVPAGGHAYVFGEPGRLARVILAIGQRNVFSADDWAGWFAGLADPAPLATWGEAYGSEVTLARVHNLRAFAEAAYIRASLSDAPGVAPISDGALSVLMALY
ncbi:DUF2785 domain-containing protein [Hyphomonas johnsonii]|uniref:Lipoprotein n=1 Tax=Hyphomonas johnsonii MHS-2 TaxID=1280950 RepID=A0A059FQL7_9PROT|nr:DUF2785 domain-containing protein [Hyphomonas johnsonii]KCZ92944.1 hypothetical protein HJO_08312 [Hyphomonas johnsonii MHS-2]